MLARNALKPSELFILSLVATFLLLAVTSGAAQAAPIVPPMWREPCAFPIPFSPGEDCATCHLPVGSAHESLPRPLGEGARHVHDTTTATHSNGQLAGAEEESFSLDCGDCHDIRSIGDNMAMIRSVIRGYSVVFTQTTGADSFDEDSGDADDTDDICVTCHINATDNPGYPMANHAGGDHDGVDFRGTDCTTCHEHQRGFMVSDTGCLGCHEQTMGARRPVNRDFTPPDYALGAHHPITYGGGSTNDPAQNNCLICHEERAAPPQVHANGSVDLDTDPDGSGGSEWNGSYPSWWCLDCHDGAGPSTLAGRVAPDKRDYYSQPGAHYSSPASANVPYCGGCHQGDPQNPYESPEFYPYGYNGHTVRPGVAYFAGAPETGFTTSHVEENLCYDCHGGFMNARRYDVNPGQWMENIWESYSGQAIGGRYFPISSRHMSDTETDAVIVCRQCHDPHTVNRYNNNMIIDPDDPTTPWPWAGQWTTDDTFCQRCHDGSQAGVPVHDGIVTTGKNCVDCHLVHASTLPSLQYLSDAEMAGVAVIVTPTVTTVTVGSTTALTATVSGAPADRIVPLRWQVTPIGGGSTGTVFTAADVPIPIPDPPSAYQPAGGITSTLTIASGDAVHDVDVYVDVSHGYEGDLGLFLTHDGKTVLLQRDSLWGWSPFSAKWYDSERRVSGSTAPAQNLSAFYGDPAGGTWQLTVVDYWNGTAGTLVSWKLQLDAGVVGTVDHTGHFTAVAAGVARVEAVVGSGRVAAVNPVGSDWWNLSEAVCSGAITVTVGSGGLMYAAGVVAQADTPQLPASHSTVPIASRTDCGLCHLAGTPATPESWPQLFGRTYLPLIAK